MISFKRLEGVNLNKSFRIVNRCVISVFTLLIFKELPNSCNRKSNI